MARLRMKICGITNLEDALLACELGADALGFIFFSQSPRAITPRAARTIIDELPPYVTPVAVVVNESVAAVSEIMAVSRCRVAQLHGEEPPDYLERLAWPAVKGFSVATTQDLDVMGRYTLARGFLLDTKVAGQYGGTGMSFDWRLAREAKKFGRQVILAGGLSPENVAEALLIAQPDAIDVGSRVEREPGRKDPERLRALFAAVNAATAQAPLSTAP